MEKCARYILHLNRAPTTQYSISSSFTWSFKNKKQYHTFSRPIQESKEARKLRSVGQRIAAGRNGCLSLHTSAVTSREWSYVHGASSIPLLGETIGNLLQDRVESHPDKLAVIFYKDQIKLTFAELLEKVDMLAAGFVSLGIQRGDRLGIWGPNTVEWILTQYATARAGIILVNINPSYRTEELKYSLQKSSCKGLVAASGFKGLAYQDMLHEIMPEMKNLPHGSPLSTKELPDLRHVITMGPDQHPGSIRFDDLLTLSTPTQKQQVLDMQHELQFDDPINIQFTSGTTGTPKGATLTHHNIVNNSFFVGLRCGYHEHDLPIICIPVPLYHCFGMVMGSMQMLTHGARSIWPSPSFDPQFVLEAIAQHRCTSLYGVPTMFIDILNHPLCDQTDTTSLVTGIMAGSPCPIETMREVLQRMNMHKFTVCYGSTETSPVSFQSTGECTVERRVSTVGKVLDHIEGKVVDLENKIVPVGTTGELCTRGYSNMLGYWEDLEKTAKAITPSQWYHTGDLAVMTEDGYCSIVGRIKDMLIRGGENIYPLEIEQVLYKHPKIKDVQVIGVPDKRLGEQVCAWIVVKEGMSLTEEEVKSFCKDKMAKFKIPYYIMFVDGFPITVTGKIQKFKMREEAIKILGMEQ